MLDPTYRAPGLPPRREPIFNVPSTILLVLVALVAIHVLRLLVPPDWDDQIVLHLSFIPGRVTFAFDPARVAQAVMAQASGGDVGLAQAQLGRSILLSSGLEPWTVVTYGLLHADWAHLGLNAVWLLAFGAPVARRLGLARFLVFLLATTVAGAAAHYATHIVDLQPVIGASAAVSGCMGAALRFMFQPQVPVSAIIGLPEQARQEAFRRPLVPLLTLARDRRAASFFVAWFVTNLLFGIGSVSLGLTEGAVAWQAHIGGFLLGLLGFRLFDAPSPAPEAPGPESPGPVLGDPPN